jgi:hypothetical protein
MNAPWITTAQTIPAVAEDEQELKDKFAEALLRTPNDPFARLLSCSATIRRPRYKVANYGRTIFAYCNAKPIY